MTDMYLQSVLGYVLYPVFSTQALLHLHLATAEETRIGVSVADLLALLGNDRRHEHHPGLQEAGRVHEAERETDRWESCHLLPKHSLK